MAATRIPTDADTLLCWTMDETALPYANSGTGGTLNLATGAGSPSYNQTGVFVKCVSFAGNSHVTTGNTAVEPSATAMTVSCWVKLVAFTANGIIVAKCWGLSPAWSNPWITFDLEMSDWSGGWMCGFAISGVYRTITSSSAIPLNTWTHLAATFDGAAMRIYRNGILCGTLVVSGSLDFNAHGPYVVGATPSNIQCINGAVDDVRIESVVRSAAYLSDLYVAGSAGADRLGYVLPSYVYIGDAPDRNRPVCCAPPIEQLRESAARGRHGAVEQINSGGGVSVVTHYSFRGYRWLHAPPDFESWEGTSLTTPNPSGESVRDVVLVATWTT